jgi:hypothetical protein
MVTKWDGQGLYVNYVKGLEAEVDALRARVEELEIERDLAWDACHITADIANRAGDRWAELRRRVGRMAEKHRADRLFLRDGLDGYGATLRIMDDLTPTATRPNIKST